MDKYDYKYIRDNIGYFKDNSDVYRNIKYLVDEIEKYEKVLDEIEEDENLNVDVEYFRDKYKIGK